MALGEPDTRTGFLDGLNIGITGGEVIGTIGRALTMPHGAIGVVLKDLVAPAQQPVVRQHERHGLVLEIPQVTGRMTRALIPIDAATITFEANGQVSIDADGGAWTFTWSVRPEQPEANVASDDPATPTSRHTVMSSLDDVPSDTFDYRQSGRLSWRRPLGSGIWTATTSSGRIYVIRAENTPAGPGYALTLPSGYCITEPSWKSVMDAAETFEANSSRPSGGHVPAVG